MRAATRSRLAVVPLAALVLAACGEDAPADPGVALQSAFAELASQSYAFSATLEAGEGAGPEAAILGAGAITGVVDSGNLEASVKALGTNFVSLRTVDGQGFLRIDVPSLSAFTGQPLTAEDLELLVGDQNPDAQPVLAAIAAGNFIALPEDQLEAGSGVGFADGLVQSFVANAVESDTLDPEASAAAARELAAELLDFDGVIATYLTVTEVSNDDTTRVLDVDVNVRALGERLVQLAEDSASDPSDEDVAQARADVAELPETADLGAAEIVDGVLHELTIDLGGLAASLDPEAAAGLDFALRLEFSDFGAVDPIVAPTDAVEIPEGLLEQLGQQANDLVGLAG